MIKIEMLFEQLTKDEQDVYDAVVSYKKANPTSSQCRIPVPAGITPEQFEKTVQKLAPRLGILTTKVVEVK
jgi:hypothetical protein